MKQIIAQGAEAILTRENNKLIKERIKKSYRLQELDSKIRKQCTRDEYNLMTKAISLIPAPKIINYDAKNYKIAMEFIDGKKLSENLDLFGDKKREEICKEIGKQVALLHNSNMIHGDLTTSNMILSDKLYFIDFGLGFISDRTEDKAVDLHLLKQALESKHWKHFEDAFKFVLEGYKTNVKNYNGIIERLKKVEQRGRYKSKN
ncbi:MAG: KEOPS complex kinase/ATPase Bud32 [Nanoarchaeota archaeon]